jgi:predicted ArsR family transcriptional regulator
MAVTAEILEETGYEPYRRDDGCLRVRNCPFHRFAEQDRELVCGMNERLVEGIVRGLGNETLDVVLDQVPGECCVRVDLPARR